MGTNLKNKLFVLIAITIVCFPSFTMADDNEIFGVSQEAIEPNILIIIDNSGSMGSQVTLETNCWQECTDWECPGTWECQEEGCIRKKRNGRCKKWGCVDWECCVDGNCTADNLVCANYEEQCNTEISTRMAVAKETVKDIIDQQAEVNRIGIMTFHNEEGGYIPAYDGKYATCSVKDAFFLDDNGDKKTGAEYENALNSYKSYMKGAVDTLTANGYTPLAETLFEAGRYFAQEATRFNTSSSYYPTSGSYPDSSVKLYNPDTTYDNPPIEYECRKNYVILMTDGQPTKDMSLQGQSINGHTLPASNDYSSSDKYRYYRENDPELQDVAGLLFDNDINGHMNSELFMQNVTTYTIGFSEGVDALARQLLQDTADRGLGAGDTPYVDDGGLFFYATNPEDLAQAFATIMFNINEKTSTFAAPTVPISDANKAYSGDYVYMSMFQPQNGTSRWIGNLKKYYLNDDLEFSSCDDHTPILHDTGQIKDTATSCWSNMNDGGAVNKGGVGKILSNMADSSRNIYANISGPTLTDAANHFSTSNDELTPSLFGLVSDGARDALIDETRMVNHEWKLGDFNHSRPAIASYDGDNYIFAGANDGMLHCFDDYDGSEQWAFVPSERFARLEEVYTGDHSYFMDGSPTVADTSDKKIVISGERRGGNNYYAIDITSIGSPSYLYTKTVDGQSWKQPQFVKMAASPGSASEVFLLTGGYDEAYDDNDSPSSPNGNYLLAINAENGSTFKSYTSSDIPAMTHSIVSAFAADTIDDGLDWANVIYAGDIGGNIFAFRDNNNPDDPKALDGQWQSLHLFSSGKKIFEEADFVPEYVNYWDTDDKQWESVVGDYVFFGTGDRANPLRTDVANYFYCVKNDWHTQNITVNTKVGDSGYETLNDPADTTDDSQYVILDVTGNKIQDGTLEEQEAVRNKLNKKYNRGWYIRLEGAGEKCLSSPLVYDGIVYFTTFTPDDGTGSSSDPCVASTGGGTARLYAVNYKTGAAVYKNFNTDEEETGEDVDDGPDKNDRSKIINVEDITIAPNPLLIISEKGEKLAVGPSTDNVQSKSGVRMFYWNQR